MVTGDVAPANRPGHAFLYAGGTMRDLGTLPGGSSSIGLGVNDTGQVAGSATTAADRTHAILAGYGGMRDLGTLGGDYSYGIGIDDAGHVAGASTFGGINDSRQILGYACRTSDVCRPVRLDPVTPPPVPEPGAPTLLLAGVILGVGAVTAKKNRTGSDKQPVPKRRYLKSAQPPAHPHRLPAPPSGSANKQC